MARAGSSFLHVLGDSALYEGDLGSHWWVRQGRKWLREAGVEEMDGGGFRAGPTRLLLNPTPQSELRGSWRQS